MFLAYLDSSGRPTFDDKENYVLTAIITNEINWQYIDNGIKAVKLLHLPHLPDSEVEFHAKDMMNRQGIYNGLSWEEIFLILNGVFDFISDDQTLLSIISVLINKTKLYPDKDAEVWAHRLLFERINKFIEKQNAKLIMAQSAPQYGIMILDSTNPKHDQILRQKLYGMLKSGTLYCKLEYLIEDPLFTDSKWRNLSQIADCVAYCVRRRFKASKTNTTQNVQWNNLFRKIEKFDANENGNYFGY